MVKLVIDRQCGFVLWMISNGFEKHFEITTDSAEPVIFNSDNEPYKFDNIIDAVDSYNTLILDDNERG